VISIAALLALTPAIAGADPPRDATIEIAAQPVLLIMTEDDELGAAVARAIDTELNDIEIRLEARSMSSAVELRERIEAGEALVRERDAIGLLWIEAGDDELVVFLVVAEVGMLRRPVVGLEDPDAAIEAAAIIVRHFALDLLAGRPIGLSPLPSRIPSDPSPEPTEPEPERNPVTDTPPPSALEQPTPLLVDRGHLRLQAGYVGQPWIRERSWEHGVEINAGWRFAVGAHVEAGVAITPAFELELKHPGNLGAAQLRVRRYPLALVVGYQRVWQRPRLALDAQLRVVGEIIERSVFDPNNITPQLDRPVHVVPALEPRLVFDYLVIPQLAVFAALGVRASLVSVDYQVLYVDGSGVVIADQQPLTPRIVSPVVLAGVDMYF
jgi:hypothetical protein